MSAIRLLPCLSKKFQPQSRNEKTLPALWWCLRVSSNPSATAWLPNESFMNNTGRVPAAVAAAAAAGRRPTGCVVHRRSETDCNNRSADCMQITHLIAAGCPTSWTDNERTVYVHIRIYRSQLAMAINKGSRRLLHGCSLSVRNSMWNQNVIWQATVPLKPARTWHPPSWFAVHSWTHRCVTLQYETFVWT
jgi:hypothetical protein